MLRLAFLIRSTTGSMSPSCRETNLLKHLIFRQALESVEQAPACRICIFGCVPVSCDGAPSLYGS
jgi:hypothetical protein